MRHLTMMSHDCHGVVNHQPFDSLCNSLPRQTSKERSKVHWGESTSDQRIPLTKGQQCKKSFHLMMPPAVEVSWPRGWFNIKITSYHYRKSHGGDKTILRSSYLHNGISYTGKMTSLYWIRALRSNVPLHLMTGDAINKHWHSINQQ